MARSLASQMLRRGLAGPTPSATPSSRTLRSVSTPSPSLPIASRIPLVSPTSRRSRASPLTLPARPSPILHLVRLRIVRLLTVGDISTLSSKKSSLRRSVKLRSTGSSWNFRPVQPARRSIRTASSMKGRSSCSSMPMETRSMWRLSRSRLVEIPSAISSSPARQVIISASSSSPDHGKMGMATKSPLSRPADTLPPSRSLLTPMA